MKSKSQSCLSVNFYFYYEINLNKYQKKESEQLKSRQDI